MPKRWKPRPVHDVVEPDDAQARDGEAGCDDALVGIGQQVAWRWSSLAKRERAQVAVRSALADVKRAIPSAKLVEAVPDFVGLTDVAEIMGGVTSGDAQTDALSCRYFSRASA